ncbi:MAG: efflux RND transporter periplasmic adaptor subunit [Candidatus Delongbacteria bacterium]|nr:efflux RND transporter periplasmic adaptor subunit [Candidatus Delongbacteria bacterium]
MLTITRNKFIILIVIIITLFLVWKILIQNSEESTNGKKEFDRQAVAVKTELITIEPIQEIKELSGSIFPAYKFTASSKLSGKVLSIRKNIGDTVEKGEVIALLDDSEYRQDVIEAEANLEIANANLSDAGSQLVLAKQDFTRAKSLKDQGFSSDYDFAKAETSLNTYENRVVNAKAQVMQKESALRSAQINLEYTKVRSSDKGMISERFLDEGNNLSQNSPIATVIGIETVTVKTSVVEDVYTKIKTGQEAKIEVDAFKERSFTGHIKRLAPSFSENTRSAAVEIEIENKEHLLKPGMFCKIKIIIQKKESAVTVPFTALINLKGIIGIYLVDKPNSTVKFVLVETGIRNTTRIEVISPEIEGEVVTLGQHLLSDGAKIMIDNLVMPDNKEQEPTR